jgi:hypothetical protein
LDDRCGVWIVEGAKDDQMACRISGSAQWAEEQFGLVDLEDKRLNRRVMQVAESIATDPSGSVPRQSRTWKQTKGAYRLFDHPKATFESLSEPYWQETRTQCQQCDVVLLIQDTTWLDYASHRATQGLGWHGSNQEGKTRDNGLFLHGVLAVEPQDNGSGRVLGLAWNTLWSRQGKPIGSDQQRRSKHRRSDQRESLRWTKAITTIGSPPAEGNGRYLHVGDRESDMFALYQATQEMKGVGFVVRVFRGRNATLGHDTPATLSRPKRSGSSLLELCRKLPVLGEKQMWIGPRANKAGRFATLSVAGAAVTLWSPQLKCTGHALRCWAVRVFEAHPPQGGEAIEWLLLTSEPVCELADALKIAGYYTLRWLIEEYHHCLKSGCKVEERQLETVERLKPLIAMLCAVAVRLLQLKNDARLVPDHPAREYAPRELVQTLARLIKDDAQTLTIHRFIHEVAKLGGFLDRKHDGEPGWKTIWRGWQDLSLIHAGYQLAKARLRCG